MIPEGWKEAHLSSLIYFGEAGVSVNSEDRQRQPGELGILKTSAVTYGRFDPLEHKAVLKSEEDKVTAKPKKDCILVSRMNTLEMVGASVYVDQDYEDLFLPDRLWQAERKSKDCSMKWLSYVLASPEMRAKISNIATGTSGSMKNITKPGFLSLRVSLPPLPEQRAIAAILGTWDRAIALTERRLAAAEQRKKALVQQLLTGRVRFPEFAGEAWREITLKQVVKLTAGGTPSTLIPEYWNGDIRWMKSGEVHLKRVYEVEERITQVGLDNSSAKLIPENSVLIALAGQGITRGIVAINKVELSTNQSIAAIIPDSNLVYYEYLFYNLDARYAELRRLSSGEGGRGGLNLQLLSGLKIMLPSIPEQRRIAAVLNACDRELDLLRRKRDTLQRQKKGLMQQLLTGRVRIKV